MPQMMSINWILSLLFFIFIMLFNVINYFIFNINYNQKTIIN